MPSSFSFCFGSFYCKVKIIICIYKPLFRIQLKMKNYGYGFQFAQNVFVNLASI